MIEKRGSALHVFGGLLTKVRSHCRARVRLGRRSVSLVEWSPRSILHFGSLEPLERVGITVLFSDALLIDHSIDSWLASLARHWIMAWFCEVSGEVFYCLFAISVRDQLSPYGISRRITLTH